MVLIQSDMLDGPSDGSITLSYDAMSYTPDGAHLIEQNRARCIHLLENASSHISAGYGNFDKYIATYVDYFMQDEHSLDRTETLQRLQKCSKKPPCGFLHEFSIFRGKKNAPPYDYEGLVPGPSECPLRLDNAHCAHSNVLGLMLRAIILTGNEEKATHYLEPFFRLMIQDGQFATVVQMGEHPYRMDNNGLQRQISNGERIMGAVEEMIALLA